MLTIIDHSGAKIAPEKRVFSDSHLISLIQLGLPLTERPYLEIARKLGVSEHQVITRISNMIETGLIKRLGIIVRHHELGYRANAMIVWNIPDDSVHKVADLMKEYSFVTLCYRRPRRLPDWPYNLFCMIHGRDRECVISLLENMIAANNWQDYPYDVLFSKRRFKQCGASVRKVRVVF